MSPSISYTTECRTINVKTCPANSYKEMCQNFNSYELIPNDRKVKPYFDIEIKPKHCTTGQEYLDVAIDIANLALTEIVKHFNDPKSALLNASSANYTCCQTGETKWIISLHIVVSNYKISKQKCLSIVKEMNQTLIKKQEVGDYFDLLDPNFQLFDESIYDANRKIRSCFANKTHWNKESNQLIIEDRPFVIENDVPFEDTIITEFFDKDTIEIPDDLSCSSPTSVVGQPSDNIYKKLALLVNNNSNKQLLKLTFFVENGFANPCKGDHLNFTKIGYALANEFKEEGRKLYSYLAEQYTSDKSSIDEYNKKYDYFINSANNKCKLGTVFWIFKKYNANLFQKLNKEWINKDDDIDMITGIYLTGVTADYFKLMYGDFIITSNEKTYLFNGVYWSECNKDKTELRSFVDKVFCKDLIEYGQVKMNELTKLLHQTETEEDCEIVNNKIKKVSEFFYHCNKNLRHSASRGSYIADIVAFTTNDTIEFDQNPYLFAFNNKIWDLENACWVEPEPLQYICKTTGYDFIEPSHDKVSELDKLLDSIFPNPLIRDYYLTYLSTGLSGIQMEDFMVATGVGGNGKSLINGLMMSTVGQYGYAVPSAVFSSAIKAGGANPELANLNNIRFALTAEPDAKKKFCCSTIKTITGDATLPVRDLYSSKVGINLKLSLVCEANDVPDFDEVNQAVNRRVKATVFEAIAIDKADYAKLDETEQKKYIIKNPFFKTAEFKTTFRILFFQKLCTYFTVFKKNSYTLQEMPTKCKSKVVNLLASGDGIYSWFEELYEPNKLGNPIKLTDIYNEFSSSSYFSKLSKPEQRNLNRKKFLEKISINIFLQKDIKLRKTFYKGIQLSSDSIVGWVAKVQEDEMDL
jgi:hypothetical protein